jgi:hypothetical protein
VALDIPSMRTTIPITAIHRRNGYVSSAAKALLKLLTEGADSADNPLFAGCQKLGVTARGADHVGCGRGRTREPELGGD